MNNCICFYYITGFNSHNPCYFQSTYLTAHRAFIYRSVVINYCDCIIAASHVTASTGVIPQLVGQVDTTSTKEKQRFSS